MHCSALPPRDEWKHYKCKFQIKYTNCCVCAHLISVPEKVQKQWHIGPLDTVQSIDIPWISHEIQSHL